jgi:hypothetical protein
VSEFEEDGTYHGRFTIDDQLVSYTVGELTRTSFGYGEMSPTGASIGSVGGITGCSLRIQYYWAPG